MTHPYRQQEPRAFWKRAVSPYHPLDVADWYRARFELRGLRIATAGSCFAQHIGRHLRQNGFEYLDVEPAPAGLPPKDLQAFGYEMYSARYGNVYTARQLLQLLQRAMGRFSPAEDHWDKDGGVVDPFRPTIEPEPFGSVHELRSIREDHLARVEDMFRQAEVFVFTLGLTEAWISRIDGATYPICPGTAGGVFDSDRHVFHNLGFAEVLADMQNFLTLVRELNPGLRILLTVSPVPLMATATDQQVVVATTYSKSVLRAVAGELCHGDSTIDYFPSYEIITAPCMKGFFFEADAREVSPHGVSHVMSVFFNQHSPPESGGRQANRTPAGNLAAIEIARAEEAEQVKCDEELLAAFGEAASP